MTDQLEKEAAVESTEGPTEDSTLSERDQRNAVRERYGEIAVSDSDERASEDSSDGGCCGGTDEASDSDSETSSCCGDEPTAVRAETLGYSSSDIELAPEGSNLGLGCGNPQAIAELEPGETVLDLGSGGGFDCFLAAEAVGEEGQVIGVDMTPEMVERARTNAETHEIDSVEFRLGEIEHLPVADGSVDVIMSNCVINLSPAKRQVFEEAFRVLAPGGRLAISDIVLRPGGLDALDRSDPDQIAKCVGGAEPMDTLRDLIEDVGFESVAVEPTEKSTDVISEMDDDPEVQDALEAALIRGRKPSE